MGMGAALTPHTHTTHTHTHTHTIHPYACWVSYMRRSTISRLICERTSSSASLFAVSSMPQKLLCRCWLPSVPSVPREKKKPSPPFSFTTPVFCLDAGLTHNLKSADCKALFSGCQHARAHTHTHTQANAKATRAHSHYNTYTHSHSNTFTQAHLKGLNGPLHHTLASIEAVLKGDVRELRSLVVFAPFNLPLSLPSPCVAVYLPSFPISFLDPASVYLSLCPPFRFASSSTTTTTTSSSSACPPPPPPSISILLCRHQQGGG